MPVAESCIKAGLTVNLSVAPGLGNSVLVTGRDKGRAGKYSEHASQL